MKLKPLSNSSFKMKFVPNLLPIFRGIEIFLLTQNELPNIQISDNCKFSVQSLPNI